MNVNRSSQNKLFINFLPQKLTPKKPAKGQASTKAMGEEGGQATTMSMGEEGGRATTMSMGEEGGNKPV